MLRGYTAKDKKIENKKEEEGGKEEEKEQEEEEIIISEIMRESIFSHQQCPRA